MGCGLLTSCLDVLGNRNLVLLRFCKASSSSSVSSSSLAGQESMPVAASRTSGMQKPPCKNMPKERHRNRK